MAVEVLTAVRSVSTPMGIAGSPGSHVSVHVESGRAMDGTGGNRWQQVTIGDRKIQKHRGTYRNYMEAHGTQVEDVT